MAAGYSRVRRPSASDASESDAHSSRPLETLPAHRNPRRGSSSRLRREDDAARSFLPKTRPLAQPVGRRSTESPATQSHQPRHSATRGTSLSSSRPSSSQFSTSSSEEEPVIRHHRFPPPNPCPSDWDDLPDIPTPKPKPRLPSRNVNFSFPSLFNHDGLPHYPLNRYLPVRAHSDTEGRELESAQEHDRAVVRAMEARARAETVDASTGDNLCLPLFLSISLVLFPVILTCFILACVFMLTGTSGGV
ncbi:hypothetical protein C6P46_006892 [Rhodotorula mucilaginosa]|jgi:hypothetical protein|uniref:Uncharacterized protein n=1 Tax=Rhodotorula mucilaginosa TaxID=5537 RepID=A0A9P6VW92_RHOMI|nr:hypothetical protein C6P46_006892 [Rhodotorula mucilaginosa]